MFLGYGIIQIVQKMLLLKRRWPDKNLITLFTIISKFRFNLTQRVMGSLVYYKKPDQGSEKKKKHFHKYIWKLSFLFKETFLIRKTLILY